jgi:hypothetical protein
MVYDRPSVIGGWAREGLRLSGLTGEDADRWGDVGEQSGCGCGRWPIGPLS